MTEREDDKRLASGWGRRGPKPADRDWSGGDRSQRDTTDADEDLQMAGDEGPITGRAATREPQDLATGDTIGGARDEDPITPEGSDEARARE